MSGVWIRMVEDFVRDQSLHLPVLTSPYLPGLDSMRSEHAQQRRMEFKDHKHDRT